MIVHWICNGCGFHYEGTNEGNDFQYCWKCGQALLCKKVNFRTVKESPVLNKVRNMSFKDAVDELKCSGYQQTSDSVFKKGNGVVQFDDNYNTWEQFTL